MSRNKRGGGADATYANHLLGTPFANNPQNNRQAITERMYQRVLSELAMNRFKWTGLPETVDVRHLETTLFYNAVSIFYYDTDYDSYFALKGGAAEFLNMVNNPTGFVVIGNNLISKTVGAYQPFKKYEDGEEKTKAIPIWANYLRMPDWDIVMNYSKRLATIDRTIDINSENARRTKMIVTADNTRLSFVNINRQIDEGQDAVQVKADGVAQDLQFIQALDMNINVADIEKLHIVRTRLWNECMGLLGIENANQDKKERLVEAEVGANDDQTAMMRYVNLNSRKYAVKQINEVFGLKIDVEYYTDELRTEIPSIEESDNETGDEE